jgi:hypothetical protein
MRKLLGGIGYLTWFVCNLGIIYGLGMGAIGLIQTKSIGEFLGYLALGLLILMCLIVLSLLFLGIVAMFTGDKKIEDWVTKALPFLDI